MRVRLLGAHLVDRRLRLFVHRAAAGVDVGIGCLVDGCLPRLEGLAVVAGSAGLGELRLELLGRVGHALGRWPRRAPEQAVGRGTTDEPGQPGGEAPHAADATVAAASCPVTAPFSPERRKQSGPIQTMGRKVIGTLTTYEILLMLDPEGAESHQDEVIARVRELVEKGGGTWRSHDAWGRRRLAYEIAKKPEGVYHLVVFECNAETLDEISRVLKIDDAVLRHLATKHIEGSRTSAPRDDTPVPAAAPAPAPAAPAAAAEPEAEPEPEPEQAAVATAEEPETAEAPTEGEEE